MNSSKILKLILSLLTLGFVGCTNSYNSVVDYGWAYGVGGGAAGAGTGALIGEAVSGVSAASGAGIGAAIGVPAGVILGVGYSALEQEYNVQRNNSAIRANQEQILESNSQVESIRNEMTHENFGAEPDESLHEYEYTGPSLGNYYR